MLQELKEFQNSVASGKGVETSEICWFYPLPVERMEDGAPLTISSAMSSKGRLSASLSFSVTSLECFMLVRFPFVILRYPGYFIYSSLHLQCCDAWCLSHTDACVALYCRKGAMTTCFATVFSYRRVLQGACTPKDLNGCMCGVGRMSLSCTPSRCAYTCTCKCVWLVVCR